MNVFISYSSKEKKQAMEIRALLIKNGFSVWMAPESIPFGENYMSEIPTAIEECDVFLILLSDKCQNSKWVLKELQMAINFDKTIIPYRIEDCPLKKEYVFGLLDCQFIPAFENCEEALKKLLLRVSELVGNKSSENSGKEMQQGEKNLVEDKNPESKEEKTIQQEKITAEIKKDKTVTKEEKEVKTEPVTKENGNTRIAYKQKNKDGICMFGVYEKGKFTPIFKCNPEDELMCEKSGCTDKSGIGELNLKGGSVYYGKIVNGKADGKGMIFYSNGDVYIGNVQKNHPHGKGRKDLAAGGQIIGEFTNGIPNGKGIRQFPNGKLYTGDFNNGAATGKGKIVYKNGDVYEGDVVSGTPKGQGKMIYTSLNESYTGGFNGGVPDGYGVYVWPNGDRFEGYSKKGRRHGTGKFIWATGNVYEGEFFEAKVQGHGKMTYANGEVCEGEFKNYLFDGEFIVTPAKGTPYKAVFSEGKIVKGTIEKLSK